MPEYDVMGNPITVSIDGVEICTAENVTASLENEIIKLEEEQKKLIDSIKNGCEISGTYKRRDRRSRQKEKLPKKLRNGWS